MGLTDCRGMPVSTTNRASLAALERATSLTVSYFLDPMAEVERALAEDPDFIMGHCLRAAMAVMSTEKSALPMLADSLAAIERRGAIGQRPRAGPRRRRPRLAGGRLRPLDPPVR